LCSVKELRIALEIALLYKEEKQLGKGFKLVEMTSSACLLYKLVKRTKISRRVLGNQFN
jgi:hypothetical protein